MNHYAARQRQSDQRWDYTIANNGQAHAVGYCAGWRELDTSEPGKLTPAMLETLKRHQETLRPHQAKYHTTGHGTADEACECYRQYLLDTQLRLDGGETSGAYICEADGCTERTARRARIVGSMRGWHLCDRHRTREGVEQLLTVGEEWSS